MSSLSEPSHSTLITQIKLHTSKRNKIRYFRNYINGGVKDKSRSVNTRRDGAYLAVYPSLIRPDAEEMIALSLPLPHRGAFIQVSREVGLYAGGALQAVFRASTCEIKPQCFQHHSPIFTSFPSSPSFPRLPCVTPSYPEERLPGGRSSWMLRDSTDPLSK